jgi:ubiquinone/menaquinone biosynthesis C-methylase UbiE
LAFDLSDLMIRKAAERHLPGQAGFFRASAHALPVRSASFDSAICFHAFPHFEDPSRVLAELARALKAGGTLWIDHLKGRAGINKIHRNAGPEIRSHLIPPAATMKKLLRAAGFRVKHLRDSPAGYSVLAVRDCL